MENPTGKQLLIQIGIQLITSAIVSYVMYRILEKKTASKPKTTSETVQPSQITQTTEEETA